MRFQAPLEGATLRRRYNRFLADVELDAGGAATAHCPNPGAMLGLAEPGMRIWLEPNDDPKRKLRYGWRLVELPQGHWAGIDTSVPNKVVEEALKARRVASLSAYRTVRREVACGAGSRFDFFLTEPGLPDAWVEVKNVHLRRGEDWAEFPDCVTKRGAKHLDRLAELAQTGARAVMLYVIQRTDCARMRFAADIDPAYAAAFARARSRGVEALALRCAIDRGGVALADEIGIFA